MKNQSNDQKYLRKRALEELHTIRQYQKANRAFCTYHPTENPFPIWSNASIYFHKGIAFGFKAAASAIQKY